MWKIMAEITCGCKNPCSVAFGQQRGVTPGLSFRAPGWLAAGGPILWLIVRLLLFNVFDLLK
jgi:hypothetical protein